MTAANTNPHEVLQDEILSDARRQSERSVRRAREEAEAIAAKAKADAEKECADRLAAAKAEAKRQADLVLATVSIEVGRKRSAQVEAALQGALDEARRRVESRDGIDYRETAITLVAQALARIAGDRVLVQLSEADRAALGQGWLDDARRRAGRDNLQIEMAPEPAEAAGTLIVRDPEGRQVFDQSLTARLERLWPALRRELAVRTSLLGDEARRSLR